MYRKQILAVLALSALASTAALAQDTAPVPAPVPGDRWTELQNMTPEERQAARQAERDRWRAMSAEERAAAREAAHERWQAMSEEERAAAIEKRQQASQQRRQMAIEHWEGMTPEEREAALKQREARRTAARERWESMTPEQREAARAKRAEHGGSLRGPGGFGKRPGAPRPGGGGG